MPIEYILYAQLASILGYIGAVFLLYRLLVAQKDGVIALLREKERQLESKIKELSEQTPDALVSSLSLRVDTTLKEIERLKTDGEKYRGEVVEKELSLDLLREQLENITAMLENSDLVCPDCHSPLIGRHGRIVYGEIDGREVDAEIEIIEYGCGRVTEDGGEKEPCRKGKMHVEP